MINNYTLNKQQPLLIYILVCFLAFILGLGLLEREKLSFASVILCIEAFNIIYLIFFLAYILVSWKKKTFNVFSPFFYPMAFFTSFYIISFFIHKLMFKGEVIGVGRYLHLIGIMGFLLGVYLHKKLYNRASLNPMSQGYLSLFKIHDIPAYFFLILGISLLLIYGLMSGVTQGLLTGADVSGLRRTAEVGKGYLVHPGVFFVGFISLWLFGRKYFKKKKVSVISITILFIACIFMFLTTGHKVPMLLPILIAIGLYNKFRFISPAKILSFVLAGFVIIGGLNVIRGEGKEDLIFEITNRGFLTFFHGYAVNYLPIVDMVDRGKLDLQYGKEYFQNGMLIIPRFIYPKKPGSFDYFLKEKLNLKFKGGGAPASSFGSLYLNFGHVGVIFGTVMIGFLYSLVFRIYRQTTSLEVTIISLYSLYYLLNPSLILAKFELMLAFIMFILIINKILYQAALHG